MAKRIDKWEQQHRRNVERYQRMIDDIYNEAVREAASLTPLLGNFSPDKPFSFSDYPITRQRIKKLLDGLKNSVEVAIVNGVNSEWTLANNKNNELCRRVFGDNVGRLTERQYKRYYSNNDKAREAFIARKTAGLDLSDRVWNYTDQFKTEIEMGLDLGLRDGLSADEMSRQLRQYLKYPDKLFRRVRDEHGILHLSKRAKAFHPGAGVYRSSYKNARRLAATETNIAYRTADYTRYQQLDFVVGIEVHLSGNHTLNGKPFEDICDDLAGKYPKDFKFTGWHPLCRCYVTSVLKTQEETAEDSRRILAGEEPTTDSVNEVKDVPEGFKAWIEDNAERIERAKSLPYFLKDNGRMEGGKYVLNTFGGTTAQREVKNPLPEHVKARRKEIQGIAYETLCQQQITVPALPAPVEISKRAVKEWLNQPFADMEAKNEALLELPQLLQDAVYRGCGADKHDPIMNAHLFEINIGNVKSWIIIREVYKQGFKLHSLTDNSEILKIIKKK